MIRTPARIGLSLAGIGLLAACTSSTPGPRVVTVTRSPSRPTTPPAPPSSSTPATSASTSPTPTAAPTLTKLSGTCDTLLPDSAVENALGRSLPAGNDAFVVGTPEADIGRVGYLNCRYGVTGAGAAATPALEIGISLYHTAAQAMARITATTDDYDAHGASATDTTVNGLPATLLSGGTGTGYDVPLLVIAYGQRTVAVSVTSKIASGDKAASDATALAALALERTAG
jgi:hypothetical protein